MLQEWLGGFGHLYLLDDWSYLKAFQNALSAAKTWADFESLAPPNAFASLYEWQSSGGEYVYRDGDHDRFGSPYPEDRLEDDSEWIIRPSDPFVAADLPQFNEGAYPPWIDSIFEGIPSILVEEYGDRADSFLSGSWTQFPMARAEEMVRVFGTIGIELTIARGLP